MPPAPGCLRRSRRHREAGTGSHAGQFVHSNRYSNAGRGAVSSSVAGPRNDAVPGRDACPTLGPLSGKGPSDARSGMWHRVAARLQHPRPHRGHVRRRLRRTAQPPAWCQVLRRQWVVEGFVDHVTAVPPRLLTSARRRAEPSPSTNAESTVPSISATSVDTATTVDHPHRSSVSASAASIFARASRSGARSAGCRPQARNRS